MADKPISRITIDTENAWKTIKDNVTKSMEISMETRLASLPGGKDGEMARRLRPELEARLHNVSSPLSTLMFELSHSNLRVNGHNYENFVDATEPFDEILDRRIWALDTERLQWVLTVADRRTKVPGDIHRLEENLEDRREAAEWLPDEDKGVQGLGPQGRKAADIPPPPRHTETVETFKTVVSNLSELIAAAPAQVTRATRAQTVREEINNLPS
ncbi:hypothetical protein P7C73_g4624, partial [Tremellales sp. Uapishka_1]